MSARDVDLEFEKAYQRLFSKAAPTASGAEPGSRSGPSSKQRAASSETAHTGDEDSRSRSTTPTTSLVDRPRQSRAIDAGLQALSRQASASSSRPQASQQRPVPAQAAQRERQSQPRALPSPLDALARHKAASSSKGKARAQSHVVEGEDDHRLEMIGRSTAATAAVSPHSGSAPYQGSVAYYPYSPGQASYQVSGPIVSPVPGMAAAPSQSITWTQPMLPAGAMPNIAYPGFSASVTFSQPQFFPSPPQQVQSAAVTALPSEAWPQQYTPQHSEHTAAASTSALRPQQLEDTTPPSSTHRYREARRADDDHILKKWNKEQVAQFDSKAHLKRTFAMPSPTAKEIFRANHKQLQKQKQKRATWKPLLDENGERIPRKRGRPRTRDLSPLKAKMEGRAKAQIPTRIKDEATEMQLPGAATGPLALEGLLPLDADKGPPVISETHTLFVDSARQLRWLARSAIAHAGSQTAGSRNPTDTDTQRWARWISSISARMHTVSDTAGSNTASNATIAASASQLHSQSDQIEGLFPRDKKRRYLALRKELHSATRIATSRLCIRRLLRYLAKTATSAEAVGEAKQTYLDRKHRAAKLTRHALKFARPASLDVRRLWSIWARAAHARANSGKARNTVAGQARTVSFAAGTEEQPRLPLLTNGADGPAEGRVSIKLEPESPSKEQRSLSTAFEPAQSKQLKQEPDSDGIMTPALPGTPLLQPTSLPTNDMTSAAVRRTQLDGKSPLFLRRNFRVYRLVGLSNLPLV
ncbi:hypothetical protein PSEUBRA_004429 [Kalmanozyma brasiliensis GHG001]|uniref:uncharacterized protein n=1 Tax=Kalmanozyma brasiliensis (strain GHG001) TaxID=1365824 RepID=UPI002867E689|nr:uncharacterized protein PSEUBRA_004429 [Kalmanozyma brasiliensis GHG001]KAF6767379.1 hypothetical protein PSEUBRA_004429 [Kalmanozyma brasiliensis GHG001]